MSGLMPVYASPLTDSFFLRPLKKYCQVEVQFGYGLSLYLNGINMIQIEMCFFDHHEGKVSIVV